ncbi:MAG: hypothetical protein L0J62_10455 [Corynebacterium casei]|uniref:hypothetical protein n=1 Tax=Corynebacterium casei TaxID=160386 RepID=UPI002648AD35|nr:hypothetical protein [Corynebacterium casei]MDN6286095.1 hypothetical protein [Corynebacterium casei]
MSNCDRAIKALNDVDVLYGALVSNEDYATVLQGRGLLAPDLPEPDVVKLNRDVKFFVGMGGQVRQDAESDYVQVYSKTFLTPAESRILALALLAAANYAEKEQDNEQF